jgi:hypothetical protein
MTIVKNFKDSNIMKAFLLNSFASTLIIIIAIIINNMFEKNTVYIYNSDDVKTHDVKKETKSLHIFFTFFTTFLISVFVYISMFFTFGFGGGMVSNEI